MKKTRKLYRHMKKLKKFKPNAIFKPRVSMIWAGAFAVIGSFMLWQTYAAAGPCSTTGTIGSSTYAISVPEAAQYRVWVRMQVPDSTNTGNVNGVRLEVGGNQCFTLTTTNANAVNQWQWVNSSATAASTAHITSQLAAGSQSAKIYGLKAGVKVDKVLLLRQDNPCIPSNDFSNGSPGDNCTTPPPAVTLTANPSTITSGGSSVLTWSSTNATSCTAGGGWSGAKATNGSESRTNLASTSTFTLTCTGVGGSGNRSATVTVNPAPAPTVTLTATPTSVSSGNSSVLTWSSTNATSCTAAGGWNGTKTPASGGSQSTGNLTSTQNYTLTCNGAGGSTNASATVTVTAAPPTDTTAPNIVMNITGVTLTGQETEVKVNNLKEIRWQPLASDSSGIKSLALTVNGQAVTLSSGEVRVGRGADGKTPNGDYVLRAVATDNRDNVTTVNLVVKLRHPDFNRDGIVNIFDLNALLNRWGTNNVIYNLNTLGNIDIFDLNFLLNRWNSTE